MALTLEDIKRVANLAQIEISDDEAYSTLNSITGIFSLIEQMKAVDTSIVAPMYHAQGVDQRLRSDKVTEEDQRELFQLQAPKTEAGLYLVPKVIE
ncbi:MAG: Asp-tRNA(Asn)/Glu-tRNA(Gln) amidotransferase GatCAB subunit C [Nitrosomonadaceae bacterium]|nr:Asp-tRNA(Asn)/Glu-tRNA(Gln) amidotransferase GatCAB subunit C [Nitrosomonadaceae bacterium]